MRVRRTKTPESGRWDATGFWPRYTCDCVKHGTLPGAFISTAGPQRGCRNVHLGVHRSRLKQSSGLSRDQTNCKKKVLDYFHTGQTAKKRLQTFLPDRSKSQNKVPRTSEFAKVSLHFALTCKFCNAWRAKQSHFTSPDSNFELRRVKTYSSGVSCCRVNACFCNAHHPIRRPGRCLCHCKEAFFFAILRICALSMQAVTVTAYCTLLEKYVLQHKNCTVLFFWAPFWTSVSFTLELPHDVVQNSGTS